MSCLGHSHSITLRLSPNHNVLPSRASCFHGGTQDVLSAAPWSLVLSRVIFFHDRQDPEQLLRFTIKSHASDLLWKYKKKKSVACRCWYRCLLSPDSSLMADLGLALCFSCFWCCFHASLVVFAGQIVCLVVVLLARQVGVS